MKTIASLIPTVALYSHRSTLVHFRWMSESSKSDNDAYDEFVIKPNHLNDLPPNNLSVLLMLPWDTFVTLIKIIRFYIINPKLLYLQRSVLTLLSFDLIVITT